MAYCGNKFRDINNNSMIFISFMGFITLEFLENTSTKKNRL